MPQPFMVPQYIEGEWWEVDGNVGLYAFPAHYFTREQAEYSYGGEVYSVEKREGIGARLSAPGYLDQTDTVVFDTMEEAKEYIEHTYDVDPTTGEPFNY